MVGSRLRLHRRVLARLCTACTQVPTRTNRRPNTAADSPRPYRLEPPTLRPTSLHTGGSSVGIRSPVSATRSIFYGFLILFLGTLILAFQEEVAKPLFGFDFWHGAFYLGYSLVLDVFGLGLAVGLAIMAAKRLAQPRRLDYTRPDR